MPTTDDPVVAPTLEQIATLEFKPIEGFKQLPKQERIDRIEEFIEQVRPIAIVAGELVTRDKDELVDLVRENLQVFAKVLINLGQAKEILQGLQVLIQAAEDRISVAIANVVD